MKSTLPVKRIDPWPPPDELRRLEQSFGAAWLDLLENSMVPVYHEDSEEFKCYFYENREVCLVPTW